MPAAIILAATLAALPAGRGLPLSAPLDVASTQPGAIASVRYRDRSGAELVASCVTPCRLEIPQGASFALRVEKDGQSATLPPVIWRAGIWRTYAMQPASIVATFPEAPQ